MNNYIPKQHGCPYRTSDGKCVHKGKNPWKTKRKSYCNYNKPEKCEMYNEWVELRKTISTPINTPLQSSYTEREENKYGDIRK